MGIINSFKHFAYSGFQILPYEEKEKRLLICKSCDKFNETLQQCKECGCFLQIKASWATEKGPLDKWGPELSPNQTESPVAEQQNNPTPPCGCV